MTEPPVGLVARGASPLGQAIAERLAQDGFDVAVGFEQDDEGASAAVEAVEAQGQQGLTLPARIGDPMAAGNLVDSAWDRFDGLDLLVVAPRRQAPDEPAGTPDAAHAFLAAELGDVEAVLQADLKGPLVLLQRAAERMLDDGDGRILLVAPSAELRSGAKRAGARAAEAGLASLVEDAGNALAPDVAVNGLVPGRIVDDLSDGEAIEAGGSTGLVDAMDVAEAAVDLATGSDAISGEVVYADGGARGRGDLEPAGTESEAPEDLPGLEQRVEPPDPDERIDVGEP